MPAKTFAIITDIHANVASLEKALTLIDNHDNVDQKICLGDCFALGPSPKETLEILMSIENCIFIRGNHDRYLIERLWEQEQPSLEGMNPDDPICQAIVANEKWTAEQVGEQGVVFAKSMHIAHREIVDSILVEFTHAWYQRDDMPPTMGEALNWRNHVRHAHPDVSQFLFVHGHVHIPRNETSENLTIFCQGATGLSFDMDTRGSVAFLTLGNGAVEWNMVRYDYNQQTTIDLLEERQPPFYKNLQNTIRYATIRNDE
ncbi:MAG: metallophosphoesterase family protein [Candidatus Marinimicrobia bacterium]|nr:metallophosphoesterase family protein [Candidatus Neomarinimicrobiota bacterium]